MCAPQITVCVMSPATHVCVGGAYRRQAHVGGRCSHSWCWSARRGFGCRLHGVCSACANQQPCCAFTTTVMHSKLILVCCSLPVSTSIPGFVISVSFGIPVMHICHRCLSLVFCLGSVFCPFFSVFLIYLLLTPRLICQFKA